MPVECTEMGALTKSGSLPRARWWKEPPTLPRPRQIRSVGEDVEQHIGRAENLTAVPMGGHEAEEPLQVQHRPLRSGCEDACQGTGGREDPTIHTPPIVEQIADGNL